MHNQLYRWWNKDGELLYVGISYSAMARASQHKSNSGWYLEATSCTIENFDSRESLENAERIAVKSELPKYNKIYTQWRNNIHIQQETPSKNKQLTVEDALSCIAEVNERICVGYLERIISTKNDSILSTFNIGIRQYLRKNYSWVARRIAAKDYNEENFVIKVLNLYLSIYFFDKAVPYPVDEYTKQIVCQLNEQLTM